jgi:hypothetical protein
LKTLHLAIGLGLVGSIGTASAQSVLFDFDGGPQFAGTPLDQISGGYRAHFTASGSAYSIQNIAQVIGMSPTGFSGLGLSPGSVFASDLLISFFNQSDGTAQDVSDFSMLVAPQELACDSSARMRVTAYNGSTLVGTQTAIAPNLDTYTWPTINLAFSSAQLFNNVVVHFDAIPPTGGDYGVIFVADNMQITPVPEPATVAGLLVCGLAVLVRRRR